MNQHEHALYHLQEALAHVADTCGDDSEYADLVDCCKQCEKELEKCLGDKDVKDEDDEKPSRKEKSGEGMSEFDKDDEDARPREKQPKTTRAAADEVRSRFSAARKKRRQDTSDARE